MTFKTEANHPDVFYPINALYNQQGALRHRLNDISNSSYHEFYQTGYKRIKFLALILEALTVNKAVIPLPLDDAFADPIMIIMTSQSKEFNGEMDQAFFTVLRLINNLVEKPAGLEFIGRQGALIQELLDWIPVVKDDTVQLFTYDILHILRALLKSDVTYYKVASEFP